jgi:hypothetical protein
LATVKWLGNAEFSAAVVITIGTIAGHLTAYYSSGQLVQRNKGRRIKKQRVKEKVVPVDTT